jgi:hypothetical integral membrane protein (TIGR02206 family)
MPVPDFNAFSFEHLSALGLIAALCVLLACVLARVSRRKRRWAGRAIAFSLIVYTAVFYIQQYAAGLLDLRYSLPLELCNVVLAACVLALFLPGRIWREITYFWGLGGTAQALLTPDLGRGFPSWDFILFFWSHGALLAGVVFILAATDFKPDRKSVLRMMLALNLYAAVIGALDWITGWNYGYLCRKPAVPSLLDYLGPWPWYILSLEGVALLTFLLLYRGHKFWYDNVPRFRLPAEKTGP